MADPNRPPSFHYRPYPLSAEVQQTVSRMGFNDRSLNSKVAIPRSANPSNWTTSGRVYEALLGDICPKVDSCSAQYIKQLLDKQAVHPEQVFDRKPSVSSQSSKFADSAVLLSPVPTSLLGGLDYTNEDFNRDEKVQAIGFGAPDDDRVYFSRAWKLNMSEVALLDHPNLQQVQVEGLTSFYLSSVGQVNSHDFCTTPLPVPFREEEFLDENVIQLITDNESRSMFMERLAFSHSRSFLMDNATPGIHGHTLAIPGKQCEQIVSNAVETLTPNSSLYFLYLVDLGLIMRNTVDTLYAAGAARKSWREVEMAISTLNGRIDAWLERLPPAFHFTLGTLEFERQRLSLAFLFYSAKIIITQPCLSRLTRQISGTEAGSFCDATATMCVDLAIQMLDLLPDLQDTSWVYRVSPWWHMLHMIMQPTTILLTQLLFLVNPGTTKYRKIHESISKAIYWIGETSIKDPTFIRACRVCKDLIAEHVPEHGMGTRADREKR
ncbi:putative C6 transcription factor [Aspergillus tanneri]|uniref:Transcription factor domain-containing protein n=1 Tax=Aspergillus tanneri TaxID=1220188 RepID=A0A5M9MYG8_9EURO|nr:uncharacterized protein ATNIH1004_002612 [Aspergillus tanneri]KAA8649933.1 hypothetical protein ATNIH1004_002612 [Aspergillus tanneri]